ncbi:NADPH2 dehydrogenase/N-ethylmaleimide reductase [Oryzisolibacter propanilivorax]|uniref:NADPH2 dehydrogenase/N-ethylmaleimide reductase n=1 Tax=Oryzisolibacter propanilivorax TaxID=1527607 RepID=A0A1G9NUT6_9BURK|nr:alkene reductase [Oryzisolibacter propanilivorax]SDL90348.1 NADPH2 dehydrogenase/N-ethylmaleimide reductase [Oryzisolibacter propanilivorax]
MSDHDILFTPVQLGRLALRNRIVMAPMTRNRAEADGTPNALMAEHYGQRADAGLIVAEGTWPEAEGQAYCRQPGIATAAQVRGWQRVTDAVHARGGTIVLQIMHSGRIGSRHIKPAGVRTVAPSAVQARGQVWTDAAGMQDFDAPEELSADEVRAAIAGHAAAAQRAIDAGFDGVELHGTSGYLSMQFLSSATNQRSDVYGGDARGRVRFAVECLQAMAGAIGAGRVGLRLNPGNTYNDTADEDSGATHAELMRQAGGLDLAYLHVMRAADPRLDAFALARAHFGPRLILNDGFDAVSARAALHAGEGQAISFARHFVGNPDLVERLRRGLPLARFDRKTLYTPGAAGYTDYPLAQQPLQPA